MKKKTLKLIAPILAIATIGLPIQQAAHVTHAHDLSVDTIHVENYQADAVSEAPVFSNEAKAVRYVRDQLKQRSESITLNYAFSSDEYDKVSSLVNSIINKAEEYTGIDDEGDYIVYNTHSWNMNGKIVCQENNYDGKYIYTITYLKADGDTAAAEEAAVTNKVNEVYKSLQLDGKSSYDKLKAIHDYIIDHVEYDYDNYKNDAYLVKHATYSAAITGKTVCQGYATYFYRLANKAGIECRVVDGTGNGGRHAWNLVKIDGKYYFVDVTWDDGNYDKYTYFLKGSDLFAQDHTLSDESQKNFGDYNISKTDYDAKLIPTHTHNYVTTTKREATCIDEGLSVKTCTICQDEQMIILPKTTHQWTLQSTVAATEDKDGSKTYTCSVCGETKTEAIPKLTHEHQWNKDYTVDVEPTCTKEGKKSIHCVKDDAIKPGSEETIPAKGHNWVLTNTVAATEDKDGNKTYTCSVCGETKTEAIPKLTHEHQWNKDYTVDVEPTCTKEGKKSIHCVKDDAIKPGSEETIPAKGHNWVLTNTVAATEDKDGNKTYTCSVCGETKTEAIPKLTHEHQWNKDYTVDVEPTCTKEGKKSIHCVKDDAIKPGSEETIPAKGHNWVLTNTLAATEDKEGSNTYTCSVCGETKTEVIPKLPKATWMKNQNGWWYQNIDGTYPRKQWMKIDNIWYYFDVDGYVLTDWQKINNKWYFFDDKGAMVTGWKMSGSKWYYLDDQGAMVTDEWQKIDGKWYVFDNSGAMKSSTWVGDYYLNASGAMVTNAWVGNYYVGSDGAYVKDRWIGKYHVNKNGVWDKTAGWQKNNQGWWYLNANGTVPKSGWKQIDGKWYYFNKSGYMMTGWQKLDGAWYYLGQDGTMKTGWQHISDKWYYFYDSGKMASSTWLNNKYYLKADGSMAVNEYINGYWLDENGMWSY